MMPGVVARARAIVSMLMLALCVATLALWLARYFVSLSIYISHNGLRIHPFDARAQFAPRYDAIHLGEELRPARRLRVLFEAGSGHRQLRTTLHQHLPFSRDVAGRITAQHAQKRETYSEIP